MLSPRRSAQLGLASAVAVLVTCLALLGHRSLADAKLLATRPGVVAPDFRLADATGKAMSLSDLRGSTVVLAFCPAGQWGGDDQDRRLTELAARYGGGTPAAPAAGGRVQLLAVRAGGPNTPGEAGGPNTAGGPGGPAAATRFPHLLDADGSVVKRYAASAAPTVLVIDAAGVIRYRGPLPEAAGKAAAIVRGPTVG